MMILTMSDRVVEPMEENKIKISVVEEFIRLETIDVIIIFTSRFTCRTVFGMDEQREINDLWQCYVKTKTRRFIKKSFVVFLARRAVEYREQTNKSCT